jgi:hypothetical protein
MHVRPAQVQRMESELAALAEMRKRLNDYCEAVNLPVGQSGETPCSLYGRLLPLQAQLAQSVSPALHIPGCTAWTDTDVQRKRAVVSTLQNRLARSGVSANHLFAGSALRFFLPTHTDRIQRALSRGAEATNKLIATGHELATFLDVPVPAKLDECIVPGATSQTLAANPQLLVVDPGASEWSTKAGEIRQVISAGQRMRAIRHTWDERLIESAWNVDADAFHRDLQKAGRSWWQFLSSRSVGSRTRCEQLSTGIATHFLPRASSNKWAKALFRKVKSKAGYFEYTWMDWMYPILDPVKFSVNSISTPLVPSKSTCTDAFVDAVAL